MYNKSTDELRVKLINAFGSAYQLNDAAHREDHFEEVFETGIDINKRLNLGFSKNLIMMAAYLHDLFAWSRENHHVLSAEFVDGTCHPMITVLTKEDRKLLSTACFCHRASYKGEFPNSFAELINAADRGAPSSVEAMLERAMLYRISRNYLGSNDDLKKDSVTHLKEKYGTKGYARYSPMYLKCYGSELRALQKEIDEL